MVRYSSTRLVRTIVREVERDSKRRAKEIALQRRELERQNKELEREMRTSEREQSKQQKAYARELKAHAKSQAKERELKLAQLEVEAYENQIELLLSHHKECPLPIDWGQRFSRLRPVSPRQFAGVSRRNWRMQRIADLASTVPPPPLHEVATSTCAPNQDQEDWDREHGLAKRILNGDTDAYIEALNSYSDLDEIAEHGSEFDVIAHDRWRLAVSFTVGGPQVVPAETKSLTAAGKVSTKMTPKRVHGELYQDHVCSCILRVGREVFALLPVTEVLITANAKAFDIEAGGEKVGPVYSVILTRERFLQVDFDAADPSDTIESFQHTGDFKASRKEGAFRIVPPMRFPDHPPVSEAQSLASLREQVLTNLAELGGNDSEETPDPENDHD